MKKEKNTKFLNNLFEFLYPENDSFEKPRDEIIEELHEAGIDHKKVVHSVREIIRKAGGYDGQRGKV